METEEKAQRIKESKTGRNHGRAQVGHRETGAGPKGEEDGVWAFLQGSTVVNGPDASLRRAHQ